MSMQQTTFGKQTASGSATYSIREEVLESDRRAVREIVESTGFFSASEADVAVELVDERLARGPVCGYHFVFAERDGEVLGYACFGPIACTVHSFDLYWIAVHSDHQRMGLGLRLLELSEQAIRRMGGKRVYIETSGRPQYVPTRKFYERCGYVEDAVMKDFYDDGDDKVVYVRKI